MADITATINLGGPWGPADVTVVDTFRVPGITHVSVQFAGGSRINAWDVEPLRDLIAALTEAADRLEDHQRDVYCDNCDEPIEWLDREGLIGGPEWVHTRTGGPECKRDGRLIGGSAEPAAEGVPA